MSYVDYASDPPEIWDAYDTYKGRLAFDVGANGGMLTRIFAENFDRVVAFEPCLGSFARLLSDCPPNATPLPFALASRPGMVEFEETEVLETLGELKIGDSMESIWGPVTGYRNVPAMTLDQMCGVFGEPDFIKIDTEGSEWSIVQGGVETFASRPAFVIEVHSKDAGKKIREYLGTVYPRVEVIRHPVYPLDPVGMWATHYYLRGERG